jgi:hypothetical protein
VVSGADLKDPEVIGPGCTCRATSYGVFSQWFVLLGLMLLCNRRRYH